MPTFRLGEYSIHFTIEPLTGLHALADRQIAWQAYLQLVARPLLRADKPSKGELSELVQVLRQLLATWPAPQIEEATPSQLGAVLLAVIDTVLLPCLHGDRISASGWQSVRAFCHQLGLELARIYRFFEVGAELPPDLQVAWEKER